ncbi:MAG TPA: hypothetical protein VHG28_00710 [Longimicrobiaceae bacterium]|nr:hypothetical protein [Longimicrobiaceae bacterium]
MKQIWRRVQAGVLAAGVAGVLGFGAAQAFASPAVPTEAQARACTTEMCVSWCQKQYGPYANGQCKPSGFGCECTP